MRRFFTLTVLPLPVLLLVTFLVHSGTSFVVAAYYGSSINGKEALFQNQQRGVILTDRNDQPFYHLYETREGKYVSLSDISDELEKAVLVMEDRDFYNHQGVSFKGIARAIRDNLAHGKIVAGGSTLTQQLAKNTLLTQKRSWWRKYKELVLAKQIEDKFSKDEILELYLNTVYFGEGAYGIDAASKAYFDTAPNQLTLSQSSLLAGLLSAPSQYSPSADKDRALERQKLVLDQMRKLDTINDEAYQQALEVPLEFHLSQDEFANEYGIHFALKVKDALIEEFGEDGLKNAGMKVRTTLNLDWQKRAEQEVAKGVARLSSQNAHNGAAIVLDSKTGEVLAFVGSADWEDEKWGKVDMADRKRHPGSAFKPLVYAAAFENKSITPATVLSDRPASFAKNYKPQNYDRTFRGDVLPRRALANSLNVPTIGVMEKVGVSDMLSFAKKVDIETGVPSDYGLSMGLGAIDVSLLELTHAYTIFVNEGRQPDLHFILSVTDPSGKILYEKKPNTKRVISQGAAFLISSILTDSKTRAEEFGSVLNTKVNAAVKTGTSEDYKDSLTVGYTPEVTIGVWVGNNDQTPMHRVAGSLGAAPIWKALMEQFAKNKYVVNPPAEVSQSSLCFLRRDFKSQEATPSSVKEYFLKGTEPRNASCTKLAQNHSSATPVPVEIGIGGGDVQNTPTPSPSMVSVQQETKPNPSPENSPSPVVPAPEALPSPSPFISPLP